MPPFWQMRCTTPSRVWDHLRSHFIAGDIRLNSNLGIMFSGDSGNYPLPIDYHALSHQDTEEN